MGTAERLAKNTFYTFSSQILNKIVNLVFIAIAARMLGAKAYGIFVLVSTMVLISSTLTNFGIRPMIIRMISKNKEKAEELLSNILAIRSCLSIAVYLLLLLFTHISGYSQEVRLLVSIAGFAIASNTLTDSFETIYIAFEKMRVWGIILVLSSLAYAIAGIAVLVSGYGLKTLFLTNVLTASLFTLLSGIYIWRNFFTFKPRLDLPIVRVVLLQSIPFFSTLLLLFIDTKVDIMMLSLVKGPIESSLAIGYYAPAHSILLTLMILPRSINIALLPIVSQKIYTEHDYVKRCVEKATKFVMIAVSFPIIIATTFFSKEIITLVFGPKFLPSAIALSILGWSYAFYAINIPMHSTLGSTKELKKFLPLMAGSFLLNILLDYMFIPRFSYVGAAVGTLIVLIIGFLGRFYFLGKIFRITMSDIKEYLKLFVLLGITLACLFLIRPLVPWPVLAFSAAAIYLLLLYFTKTFEKDEILFVADLIRKKVKIFRYERA